MYRGKEVQPAGSEAVRYKQNPSLLIFSPSLRVFEVQLQKKFLFGPGEVKCFITVQKSIVPINEVFETNSQIFVKF